MSPPNDKGWLIGLKRGFSQSKWALVVLAAGLAFSFVAWRLATGYVHQITEIEFREEVTQALKAIDRRLRDTVTLVMGLRGLFNATEQVTRREFELYLADLEIERHYSGLRVVSYSQRLLPDQLASFIERVRGDTTLSPRGYPDFKIKPPGERNEYLVIEFLRPMGGNEAAFGLDLIADPQRRTEVVQARDYGDVVASAPFAATVEPGRTSFAIRMAVYRKDMPTSSVEERRRAFKGMVAAVMHLDEMLGNLMPVELRNLDLTVHDAGFADAAHAQVPNPRNLLFDSQRLRDRDPDAHGLAATQTATLYVGGRVWRLTFTNATAKTRAMQVLPLLVLMGGLTTTLLLFWLVWTLSVSRMRALQLAQSATAVRAAEGLREQLEFVQQLIETVPQPIFFKDASGRYLGVNRAWERFFGISREQFLGKSVFDLYPNDPELAQRHHAKDKELFGSPGSQSYEAAVTGSDGVVRHTIYNKATFSQPDGAVAGLIGTITDVTALKNVEAALRDSEARFRDLTELSSDWYWEQDAQYRMTQISSKIEEFNLDARENIGKPRWEFADTLMKEEQWEDHRRDLEAHRPFRDFVYQRYDNERRLRTISISGRPTFDEQGRFTGYRGTGRDITDQRRAEEQIRHMAHHDALTQLPNRLLLHDRIAQAIGHARREGKAVVILFIDLDRFKNVNDSLGHHVGDELLRTVSIRLVDSVRKSDTVARIGGDEFVIVLTGVDKPEGIGQVAQKVMDTLAAPIHIQGHELQVTPSVGICVYPDDGQDVEALMRNADAAMYHAKQMGRNNYQFFTAQMNVTARHRLLLETDLRHALEREELVLHYQPQIDLRAGGIVGFEALVRWRHPQRGLVPPSDFIPVAEETGMISAIGEWVLREACMQAAAWRRAGYEALRVAVNCSAHQFRRAEMVNMVADLLKEVGLPADYLELEITETTLLQQAEHVIAMFEGFDRLGVKLSIDDFGTGYSILSYLKRFAVDRLKIDQSFVRDIGTDPNDAAIVTAIIAMGHSLELQVIAEGVETAAQAAFLRKLGCDFAQGYYYSRALPAEEFEALLENWDRRRKAVGG